MVGVEYRDGVYLPELDLWLDARGPRHRCIVSHAHGDHIAHHQSIVATPETARLFLHRRRAAQIETLGFGERRDYGSYALTFYPAGHCLGAAQVLIEADGERIVYTGDIKLRPNLTTAEAVIVPCDTLIMEATFGAPAFCFPPDEEVAAQLNQAILQALSRKQVPVVLAYALGKSQEAIEHLLRQGHRVMLEDSVWQVTEIYRELGVKFSGPYQKYERKTAAGSVLVAPPHCRYQPLITELSSRYLIMLTGWAMQASAAYRYRDVDLLLPLSDHAGFDDLSRIAVDSRAQRIITLYGTRNFAAHLRSLGLQAEHLAGYQSARSARATTAIARRLFD